MSRAKDVLPWPLPGERPRPVSDLEVSRQYNISVSTVGRIEAEPDGPATFLVSERLKRSMSDAWDRRMAGRAKASTSAPAGPSPIEESQPRRRGRSRKAAPKSTAPAAE